MKTKPLLTWSGGSMTLALGVVLIIPACRYAVFGFLNSERYEDARPKCYWICALKDADPKVREQAARCLARFGPEAADAIPALTDALQDEVPIIRARAAFALYKTDVPAVDAVPMLVAALKDDHPLVRLDASMCLSRVGPQGRSAVPALMEAVRDKANRVRLFSSGTNTRQLATAALGYMGPDASVAVPLLIELLNDDDYIICDQAVIALGRIGSPEAVPSLIAILEHGSGANPIHVLTALGNFGPEAKAAVPVVSKLLKERHESVRREAAVTLRKIDPEAASKNGIN